MLLRKLNPERSIGSTIAIALCIATAMDISPWRANLRSLLYLRVMQNTSKPSMDISEWIARNAIPLLKDSTQALNNAVDAVVKCLDAVQILGVGEALHGGEEILVLRNRVFQRLVEAHGFTAIAVESGFPGARHVNDYVLSRGVATYDEVKEIGFGHGFGNLEANRELVEWMRTYNSSVAAASRVHFYGFDMPVAYGGPASPREVLVTVIDYVDTMDTSASARFREQMDEIVGVDSGWENPMAWRDPAQSAGLLAAVSRIRRLIEQLAEDIDARVIPGDSPTGLSHLEAAHYLLVARQLLDFYEALANSAAYAPSLAVRDSLMADNLSYILARERRRNPVGKVMAFAHNMHLQRGQAIWQLGSDTISWQPAGMHLNKRFGSKYVVIGTAIGVSEDNGIVEPESGTLEAILSAGLAKALIIPTHQGNDILPSVLAETPVRTRSTKNPTYFPLTDQCFTGFDYLLFLDSVTYNRGGPPLP